MICELATQVIGSVLEHNAKIDLQNEISDRIEKYINEMKGEIKQYILDHALNEYEGEIEWFHEEYSQVILKNIEGIDNTNKTYEKLNALINKIGETLKKIDKVFENQIDFYCEHVHPILVDTITLQIATYSELSKRCNDHTGQLFILKSQENLLRNIFKYYKYKYEKSLNQSNHNYFDFALHSGYKTYIQIVKNRKILEHQRYLQWINLNCDFKFISDYAPAYGGFNFSRCHNHTIKKDENGNNVLAVNDENGQYREPSIFKDVFDISAGSSISFSVTLKSTIPRTVKLVIWELAKDEKFHVEETINIGENWDNKSIKYEKQKNTTYIRFEIYWVDKLANDLLIKRAYINFTQVETVVPEGVENFQELPLPDYFSLRNRSTNKKVDFSIATNYSSSLYYAANDIKRMQTSPSVYLDLVLMFIQDWARLNVTFEVFLKLEKDITREISLCIHELYPLGANNYEIRNSIFSEKHQLTQDWQWFSLTCERKHHTQVRCEVYWYDNNEVDILVRDPKVIFTVK